VFIALTRRVGAERKRIATTRQGTLADMSTLVEESLSVSGVLLGKTMGRGQALAERFQKESADLAELEVRSRMAGRWVMASIQMTFAIMPVAVYWFAGESLASGSGAVSIGTVVAFTTLQTRLFFPIGQLLSVGLDVQTSLALFDRVYEYLDLPVEIAERPDAGELRLDELAGEVRFEDVWFRYEREGGADSGDGGEGVADPGPAAALEWTLAGVAFTVAAGTRTAIVGETGSGKTTLAYLAARLYDVERGAARIDGVDVREVTLDSLAAAVGVVSQETYLFHSSIRDNLRFARPDASHAEIEAAARAARIHELIAGLPDGYDTVVGERGYRFSGGEKQRIAIARTILRDPPILILDEATSALDVETERAVQGALDDLARGRTTIAIAHRLSTVRDADQIVVLDHGRIVERGSHEALLDQHGHYAALVARDRQPAGGGLPEDAAPLPRYARAPMAGADAEPARPARGRRGRPGGDGSPPRGRGRPRRRAAGAEDTGAGGDDAGGSVTRKRPPSDGPPPPGADTVCFPCRGTGKVTSGLGGTPQEETCPWCEGTGKPIAEHDAQAARRGQSRGGEPEVGGSEGA